MRIGAEAGALDEIGEVARRLGSADRLGALGGAGERLGLQE